MSDLLLRGVEPETVKRLKARAKRNERSLQAELRVILHQAAEREVAEVMTFEEGVRFAAEMRKKLEGKIEGTTAELIREDRDSR
jgi:plasmid stability protein